MQPYQSSDSIHHPPTHSLASFPVYLFPSSNSLRPTTDAEHSWFLFCYFDRFYFPPNQDKPRQTTVYFTFSQSTVRPTHQSMVLTDSFLWCKPRIYHSLYVLTVPIFDRHHISLSAGVESISPFPFLKEEKWMNATSALSFSHFLRPVKIPAARIVQQLWRVQ